MAQLHRFTHDHYAYKMAFSSAKVILHHRCLLDYKKLMTNTAMLLCQISMSIRHKTDGTEDGCYINIAFLSPPIQTVL